MDESLKSLQLIQRALVGLAAALLVFVVSADPKVGPYQGALAEVMALQAAMPKVRQSRIDEENLAYATSQLATVVQDEAKKHRVSVENVRYAIAIEESEFQFMPPMYLAGQKQTIDDLYRYIRTAPTFDHGTLYQFDEPVLHEEIARLMNQAGPRLTEVMSGLRVQEVNGKYAQVPGVCDVEIQLPNPDDPESKVVAESGPIKCSVARGIPFARAAKILRDGQFFTEQDGYILPLPAMSKVWDDIAGKEMPVVVGILERKAAVEKSQNQGTLSVLGLSLNARAVSLVGPALELFMLLYMLALVRHIDFLRAGEKAEIRSFPDVGIVSTGLGLSLLISSLVILPLLAAVIVILQAIHVWWLKAGTAIGFALVWLTLSWSVLRGLKKLVHASN